MHHAKILCVLMQKLFVCGCYIFIEDKLTDIMYKYLTMCDFNYVNLISKATCDTLHLYGYRIRTRCQDRESRHTI